MPREPLPHASSSSWPSRRDIRARLYFFVILFSDLRILRLSCPVLLCGEWHSCVHDLVKGIRIGIAACGESISDCSLFSVCSSSAFPPDQTCITRKSMPRPSGAIQHNTAFLNIPLRPIAARTEPRSRRLVCARGGVPTGNFLSCWVHVAWVSKNKIRFVSNRCMG